MPSATPRKKKVSNRITMNNFDPLKFRDTLRKVIATSNPQNMHALRRAYEAETRQAISVTTFQSFILRADVRIVVNSNIRDSHRRALSRSSCAI